MLLRILHSTLWGVYNLTARLQIHNQSLLSNKLMLCVPEMQYSNTCSQPLYPPQKPKNQFCGRTVNKSLGLIVSKMLTGPSTKFCIVLVRIQLYGSVIWQQHYIQRIWLYQWKIESSALCEK